MVHPKRKRHLAFEQLDNRIAMNSDMRPSASIAFGPLQTHDFAGRLELRSVSFVTSVPTYAVVQHVFVQRPSNPPAISHRAEPVRSKVNTGMRAPAEGESIRNERVIPPPSPTVPTFGTNFAGFNSSSSESSLDSTSSRVAVTNLRIDGPQSGPLTHTPSASGSSPRELVTSNSTRVTSPVPIVDASPVKSGGEAVATMSQKAVLQSQLDLVRAPIASASAPVLQPKSLESAKRSESTISTENGMLTFLMREAADRTTENGSYGGLPRRNGNRMLGDLPLLQIAEADRSRIELTGTSNRLPAPQGMLEIDASLTENSQKPAHSTVSRASHNPFEILHLFIGSTNMVQGADGLASHVSNASRMIGTDCQGLDSTELATKEDSILALAIGVVFAITFRKDKVQNSIDKISKVVKRSTNIR